MCLSAGSGPADPQVNRFGGAFSREQALERLTGIERQWAERGHGLCAIELKASGEFVGRSGLRYWEQFDEVELGWTLRADQWGPGYATEAARACLDWGFATLDDDYFTALMRPGNEASASRDQDSLPQQGEAGAAEHLAPQYFDPVDMTLHDAGVPGQCEARGDGVEVCSRRWAKLRRLGSSMVEVAASIEVGNWSPGR
ncbi:hypothetical protein GCM10009574_079430 [Streptomyces asiaticus]|uniref:N-acetyltransferase domain-containing protein n=2 Tax=Streptomyces rhizosphaericus TaxID=114699 RepID=A0ABN1SSX9_9ACTN